jgi:hypothetical protein
LEALHNRNAFNLGPTAVFAWMAAHSCIGR